MPLDDRAATATVRIHHLRLLTLQSSVGLAVGAAWDRFGGLDDPAAEAFVAAAAPLDAGAVAATTQLAGGFYRALDAVGGYTSPRGVLTQPIRAGATPREVMLRAVITARWRISEGDAPELALRAGRVRAVSAAETDVVLANRAAHDAEGSARPHVVGYRRVLTGNSCLFCATASTQRYHKASLLPLHNHCDCDVAPIVGGTDPGQVINPGVLQQLKARGPRYWQQKGFVDAAGQPLDPTSTPTELVAVHTHGELGAVLTAAGDDFTSAADVAA